MENLAETVQVIGDGCKWLPIAQYGLTIQVGKTVSLHSSQTTHSFKRAKSREEGSSAKTLPPLLLNASLQSQKLQLGE